MTSSAATSFRKSRPSRAVSARHRRVSQLLSEGGRPRRRVAPMPATDNRFYTEDPVGTSNEVTWSRFQRILKEAGFARDVKRMSALKLDPAMADIIDRRWTRVR
jgi:hypothetical protein